MARFRILGPVEVWKGERRLPFGGPLQLKLFAFLVLHANRAALSDDLTDALWKSARPGADNRLAMTIARLRKTLAPLGAGDDRLLRTVPGGYLLSIDTGELDSEVFATLVSDGRQAAEAGEHVRAAELLREGLALWRGPTALAEVAYEEFAQSEIRRLGEMRLMALEARIDADLELGHHRDVVGELEGLSTQAPGRERIAALLMLAEYRCGRQADALQTYRRIFDHLNEELGLSPGPMLRQLHEQILNQAPCLDASAAADRTRATQTIEPDPRDLSLTSATGSVVAPLPGRLRPYGSAVFVNRKRELRRLTACLAEASTAGRRAAFVIGEPGIGKTRTVSEFAKRAHEDGALVLAGRCDNALDLPYQPIVEALEHLVEHAPSELLETHVAEYGDSIARLVPALASRLSRGPPVALEASESERYVLFRAIEKLLAAACARGPVLLVLEDLHWADMPTVTLLRRLLTSPLSPPLMLLCTCRVLELADDHPLRDLLADLHREPDVVRLELTGLQTEDIALMLPGLYEDPVQTADEQLARTLQSHTNGNPFFISEMVRGLADVGALINEDGHLRVLGDLDVADELPVSISETLARRIRRMDAPVQRCLQLAAVIGDEFDGGLISEIAGGQSIPSLLDAAVRRGVLLELPGESPRFGFAHVLLQRYLYSELGIAHRAALHAQVAVALQGGRAGRRSSAAEVARHWLAAGESGHEGALQYAARAGDEALGKLAPDEARRWYQVALELIARQHDASWGQRCDLLIRRGEAERQAGNLRFRETLIQAARLAVQIGDERRLVRAALANTRGMQSETGIIDESRLGTLDTALDVVGDRDPAARARLLAIKAAELMYSRERERRLALSNEALSLARQLNDPDVLGTVLNMRFVTLLAPDTQVERRQTTLEAVSVSEHLTDPLAQFYVHHWRGYTGIEDGDIVAAQSWFEREREIADRFRQPTMLWLSRADEANMAIVAGDLANAERLAGEALEVGRRSEPDAFACYAAQRACIAFEMGRLGGLISSLEQVADANPGVPGFQATLALALTQESRRSEASAILDQASAGRFEDLPYDVTWLAAACIYALVSSQLGDAASAAMLYALLEPWHDQIVFPAFGVWGPVTLYLGSLAILLGEGDAAESHLSNAVDTAIKVRAPTWRARAEDQLTRLNEGGP